MKNIKQQTTILFILLSFIACETVIEYGDPKSDTMNDIVIPQGFSFSTTKDLEFSTGTERLYDIYAYAEEDSQYIGRFSQDEAISITTSSVITNAEMIPVGVQSSNFVSKQSVNTNPEIKEISQIEDNFFAIGSWNINGVPNYLETTRDAIDQALVDDINASLPETRPVPSFNPEYLNGVDMVTSLDDLADVWVTFVHEGAGWKNGLGYFAYPRGQKPSSFEEVDSLFIIFPNVSFSGSGGGLQTGDKVYLGRFPANTSIGWFLVPNGFNTGTGNLSITSQIKSSIHNHNTFTSSAYNQHAIILNDEVRELLLLGFEDTTRPAGDNDFNDAIFFVSANPYEAINVEEILPIKEATDSDGDGLFDHEENYPNDPERANEAYFPSRYATSSFLVEDLWPSLGDYDFNDIVADLNITYVQDSRNRVKDMIYKFYLKANGGMQQNALMIHFPIDKNLVESVTGSQIFDNYIQLDANGTEANQSEAVVLVTDHVAKSLPAPPGYQLTNVVKGQIMILPTEITVSVTFTEPIPKASLGSSPHDIFVVPSKDRNREIHLPGYNLTDLGSSAIFGTLDDASLNENRLNFTNSNGLPWALLISNSIPHAFENEDFTFGYKHFAAWAKSGGSEYPDWYQQKSGYRDLRYLFTK